jgi:hypothetical protein
MYATVSTPKRKNILRTVNYYFDDQYPRSFVHAGFYQHARRRVRILSKILLVVGCNPWKLHIIRGKSEKKKSGGLLSKATFSLRVRPYIVIRQP